MTSASSSKYLTVEVPISTRRSMPNLKSPSPGAGAEYACKRCRTRVASKEAVLSWDYRGSKGKAALFTQASNITLAPPSILLMDSGTYRVAPLSCTTCYTPLGWKFVRASEHTERWKVGCVVLELSLLDEEASPTSLPTIALHSPSVSPSSLSLSSHSYSSSAAWDDMGYVYQKHRLSSLGTPGHLHRRAASEQAISQRDKGSPRGRQTPLGPRRRNSGLYAA